MNNYTGSIDVMNMLNIVRTDGPTQAYCIYTNHDKVELVDIYQHTQHLYTCTCRHPFVL